MLDVDFKYPVQKESLKNIEMQKRNLQRTPPLLTLVFEFLC